MQYAIQKDGEEKTSSLSLSLGADSRLLPFLSDGSCCTLASVDIKDIRFLLSYLEEKFTDKGVSTLMIKLYLDFNTWAEPLSQQARIRGSETSDFSTHLLICVQTVGPACEMLCHLVFPALYFHSRATIFFQWSYREIKWVNPSWIATQQEKLSK